MTARAYYLGPTRERWIPSSWADVVQAASDGILDETAWVELKEKLDRGPKAGLELARDLASLALSGGLFVVGIVEYKVDGVTKAGEVKGCSLTNEVDRIVQIARDRIDPPLFVDPRVIPNPDNPGTACLLVSVPASALAPHQADERYWGRSAVGKRPLGDAEVRLHLARLATNQDAARERLDALAAVDPVPGPRWHGHLYVVAVPTAARPRMLVPFLDEEDAFEHLQSLIRQVAAARPGEPFDPHLPNVSLWTRTDEGRAFTTTPLTEESTGLGMIHGRLYEDGSVAVINGRGTDQRGPQWPSETPVKYLVPSLLLGTVHDVVGVAGLLADTRAAYQGEWQIGVRLDCLKGAISSDNFESFWPRPASTHSGDLYEEITSAMTVEMVIQPWAIAERLLRRLLRAVGSDRKHLPYRPAPRPSEGDG